MNNDFEEIYCRRPHVVIVGAGASKAVMGKLCPTMNEAIEQVGLNNLLKGITLQTKSKNLEDIYSELYRRGEECKNVRLVMEEALYEYFSNVHLPDSMTIYDQLILSLTKKDCIISFNWDSLLIQAYNRVSKITRNRPEILFLHGNVGAGMCEKCMTFGPIQNYCHKCNKPYKRVPLLYPVEQKDYSSNIFIHDQWNVARDYIAKSGKVTIFGYSAPSSDKEASEILKSAFSQYDGVHRFDSVEIIERPGFDTNEISDTWTFFFSQANYHTNIVNSFYDSSLAKAPRRTMQYQYKQLIEGWWGQPEITFSDQDSFESISVYLKPLLDSELQGDYRIV